MSEEKVKKKRVAWNKGMKRTEEEKEKQRATLLEKYGVTNAFLIKEVKATLDEARATDEWKARVRQTKLERYGDENYNNQDKMHKTKLERHGDQNYNNPEKTNETKRKNKTFNTSSYEVKFYEYLASQYGELHIHKQYKCDKRYPFACDFYIDTTDTFIELNIHPCHNFKPFDPNDQSDIENLAKLREKAKTSDYYKNTIMVWTEKDPLKISIAKANNLNYIMIYSPKEVIDIIENKLI